MIIKRCDICNKEVSKLNTIILYKKTIDYCCSCEKEAEKIRKEYKQEIAYENVMFDSRLKLKERKIIKRLKEKHNKGIKIKE